MGQDSFYKKRFIGGIKFFCRLESNSNPPASIPEYTCRSGDVTVVGMANMLVATFSFLTFERNHLERPATSQIKA